MKQSVRKSGSCSVTVYTLNTVIVGSGAAGLNAADRLYGYGDTDLAIVTEGLKCGTSRNAGSDKQTYYKLSLAGSEPDSVREMAETLFQGGCVDGDIALCEAALSAQSFFRLAEAGVPFPRNRFGEYVGYKTDHDPKCRATSAGPYTGRMMTDCLEQSVLRKGIRIFDSLQVIAILQHENELAGILCLDLKNQGDPDRRYAAFCCRNTVWATGGPAGIYADSVYPPDQNGATGIALEAGAAGRNLTEWQYGIASVKPRWNVSGTYMQVLPRMFSAEQDGSGEREFLNDYFTDRGKLLTALFLKGYQWPFDADKAAGGSSVIDLLVSQESRKNRRVFLDFRANPLGDQFDFGCLSAEAKSYLERAGACFGTPVERLLQMNAPAVSFYLDQGVDLRREPLEIALCAQHNNGGLAVDCHWQTSLTGLFCAGEAAGTHGIRRPGGSALNAGQTGSTRAAQYIAACRTGIPDEADVHAFAGTMESAVGMCEKMCAAALTGTDTVSGLRARVTRNMSLYGGAFRSEEGLKKALAETGQILSHFTEEAFIAAPEQLQYLFRLRDILICQQVYLSAMLDYLSHGGGSRGSVLYYDKGGRKPRENLPEDFRCRMTPELFADRIQETVRCTDGCRFMWRKVHPIPAEDASFEKVWKDFREHGYTE